MHVTQVYANTRARRSSKNKMELLDPIVKKDFSNILLSSSENLAEVNLLTIMVLTIAE